MTCIVGLYSTSNRKSAFFFLPGFNIQPMVVGLGVTNSCQDSLCLCGTLPTISFLKYRFVDEGWRWETDNRCELHFLTFISIATGAGPHKFIHIKPPTVNGWARTGGNVEALWPGYLHSNPSRHQWDEQRGWLCKVSGSRNRKWGNKECHLESHQKNPCHPPQRDQTST